MKLKPVIPALLLALSLFMSGCGGSQTAQTTESQGDLSSKLVQVINAEHPEQNPESAKARKDTLIIGTTPPDGVLNPLYAQTSYDARINECMFDALLENDASGQPIPGLAEKWEVSPDGLEYTFHLRKDAKFWDGTPVTAADVAFSFTIPADSSYDGPSDIFSSNIKGVQAYHDGKASAIEGIQVIDPYTIKFVLDKPNASDIYNTFSRNLGMGGLIISKAYYGKNYKQGDTSTIKALNRQPMGSGPYKFIRYTEGQEVRLVANENYRQGVPKIKNLIFKAVNEQTTIPQLASGGVDLAEFTVTRQNMEQVKQTGFLTIQTYPANGYAYIGMNISYPWFSDRKVRQALAYGLNRKQIVDAVYGGYAEVIDQPIGRASWSYNPNVGNYEYNPEKAAQLLDEAGWKKGPDGIREKNGKKFVIHFSASTPNAVNDALIPIAKENYAKLGIEFIPEQMEFNTVSEKSLKGDIEMFMMAWGTGIDPDSSTIFKTKGTQNHLNYSNPKVDELLAKGLNTTNFEERKKVYYELHQVLHDDLPYIFLYQRQDPWALNCRIKGIKVSPFRDFTNDLWHAELE
jgi:peptide/nickel transport system substrate-binding protein